MTAFASPAFHFVVRAGAALDTVWVERPVAQGTFERITTIASGVITLAILGIGLALVPVAWRFRKTYKRTSAILSRVQADIAPLLKHAHAIADNVDYVSTAIRSDVATIHDTLVSANSRVQDAIALTEQRMHDFSALLAVVQQEAEGLFVSAAATVHGVRTSASRFASGDGPELASVEVDDDDLQAAVDDEEIDDGNDRITNGDADASRAPRIIRRARTRQ